MNLFVNQSVQGKWLMPHLDHCWPFVVETQKTHKNLVKHTKHKDLHKHLKWKKEMLKFNWRKC